MKKSQKKLFSFEHDLNLENLSQALNDIGILSHPLTNEQKVCIEYPNISSESKDINILNNKDENIEAGNTKENKIKNDFTLILSKTKNFTIDINKLYKKYKKNFSYNEEVFTKSIKIFVSIFNNFNEDIFKYNLEDFNLFNASNKIQFFLIKNVANNNINVEKELEKLYEEHLNKENEINNEEKKEEKINDDFDDFEERNTEIRRDEDDFEENIEIIGAKENKEEEYIYRNIYFLMNIFNVMNYFSLDEFNINNILKNISLFNSYIINDIKILLLIYFNLCIQINLALSKQTIDNFLGISSNKQIKTQNALSSVSSAINSIGKSLNINIFGDDDKINKNNKIGVNSYIPSLYFIDSLLLKENENDIEKEKDKIILFNFIIKTFLWTYFIRNKICLKIFIKIFNLDKFNEMKKDILVIQKLENKDKLYELIKSTNFVNLLNDTQTKEYLFLMNADFSLINELELGIIDNFLNIYFPIFINCNMISFEINNGNKLCTLKDYNEELNIIIWLFKFYLRIKKYKFSKHTFTFVSNSFSLAFKKNKEKKMEESYIKEITLFMGTNNYKTEEIIKYLSDINNFNVVYKLYKLIIKSCNEYKSYDIGIRFFKEDITNKELNYYISILVLKLQNYINSHWNNYKKLVLYENKLISPYDCVYINIKKKLLLLKNNQSQVQLKEKGENNVLNKISKLDFMGIIKKNGNDSAAEKNEDNLSYFYKKLEVIGLKHDEKTLIYKFINENKYYFHEFIVYFSTSIISKKNKQPSFDPLNILYHFNNNKFFFIIVDNSILDVYIYLTDSFEMNIVQGNNNINTSTNKSLFFNAIMANLKMLKCMCKESFDNKKSHLLLRNINIIINKSTLLQQDLFYDYKSLFHEDNIIYVLDEYTKTNCVFGKRNITLVPNFEKYEDSENDENDNKNYDNYFSAFYSMFLNCYGIIKFINDKKLRKFNKLNIIFNNQILQIKQGNIQIKKIENEEDLELIEKNIINNINNENNIEIKEKEMNDKIIKYISYNILKNNELFNYQNSYPLIDFILPKESDISNFSFLFYAFEEIFLSKKEKETQISKQIISKKILKFFNKFKFALFIPIIFDQNYFFNFFNFFERILNKKESQHFFQNLIIFFFEEEINYNEIIDKINKDNRILDNFVKKIHIFKINNKGNKFTKNIFGRLFKFNRINNNMKYLYDNSEKKEENEGKIIIYNINEKVLNDIIKKNNRNNLGSKSEENKEKVDIINNDECIIF